MDDSLTGIFLKLTRIFAYDHLPLPLADDFISRSAHADLSEYYQREYEAGDDDAIFEYVKEDVWAFRAPWVTEQLEKWRLEGTTISRKKCRDLMMSYTPAQGKTSHEEMLYIVQRDQEIFKAVLKLSRMGVPLSSLKKDGGCYERVAKEFNLSFESVKEIDANYKFVIEANTHGPEWKGKDDIAGTEAVVDWLDAMASRLRNWGTKT